MSAPLAVDESEWVSQLAALGRGVRNAWRSGHSATAKGASSVSCAVGFYKERPFSPPTPPQPTTNHSRDSRKAAPLLRARNVFATGSTGSAIPLERAPPTNGPP